MKFLLLASVVTLVPFSAWAQSGAYFPPVPRTTSPQPARSEDQPSVRRYANGEIAFPLMSIYNNPNKTPEQEETSAHNAEVDWASLTQEEKQKCVMALASPQILSDPTVPQSLAMVPSNTYERLEFCTSMTVIIDGEAGKPNSWAGPSLVLPSGHS